MNDKYVVLRTLIGNSGVINYNIIGSFNRLRDAVKFFNDSKKDIVGWALVNFWNGVVEISLQLNVDWMFAHGYDYRAKCPINPIRSYAIDLRKFYNI